MPMTRLETETFKYLLRETEMIYRSLLAFYAEPIGQRDLYELLIPPGDLDVMVQASMLMPKESKYSTTNRPITVVMDEAWPIENFNVNISYNIKESRTGWLWPEHLRAITPESEYGRGMVQLIDLAIQAKTSMYVFDRFQIAVNDARLTIHMLPFLKLVAERVLNGAIMYDRPKDGNVIAQLELFLKMKEPSYIPPYSAFFNQICGYGTSLVSMWAMIEKQEKTVTRDSAIVTPDFIYDCYIEDGAAEHTQDFIKLLYKYREEELAYKHAKKEQERRERVEQYRKAQRFLL